MIRTAFANPSKHNPYFLREEGGRDSIRGCMLRVQRRTVQFGTRSDAGNRWHKVAEARPDMTLEEIEDARLAVRRVVRQVEDEEQIPGLRRATTLTVKGLMEEYLADYEETRGHNRSHRTLDAYHDTWRVHLVPLIGHLRLAEVTPDVVRQLKREIPARVLSKRPKTRGGGRYGANRALQQLDSAFRFAQRHEWVTRNPAAEWIVPRYDEARAEDFLDEASYGAIGDVLRQAEVMTFGRSPTARGCLSIRTIYALRLAIYTGARHREELLWAKLAWCQDLEGAVPRIGIPRVKSDRESPRGRWVYLGPDSVRLIRQMPRPSGSSHLLVPGSKSGAPLYRLNEAWHWVLKRAKLPPMPVKVLRHSHRTHAVVAGIPEEHEAQLLGHRGAAITDTVYLHRHGPALAAAAAHIEEHLRILMGDPIKSSPGDDLELRQVISGESS
ncbi:MAG TPA: hypothetical protein VHR45_10050 [Thermoanaerobaculia bacterium]|nr:hypothetical protein [Thermoanaerobaculia bacterium]